MSEQGCGAAGSEGDIFPVCIENFEMCSDHQEWTVESSSPASRGPVEAFRDREGSGYSMVFTDLCTH